MALDTTSKVPNRITKFYDLDEAPSPSNWNQFDMPKPKCLLSSNDSNVLNRNKKLSVDYVDGFERTTSQATKDGSNNCNPDMAKAVCRKSAKKRSSVNMESISEDSPSKVLSRISTVGSDSTILVNGSNRKYSRRSVLVKGKNKFFKVSSDDYCIEKPLSKSKYSCPSDCDYSSPHSEDEHESIQSSKRKSFPRQFSSKQSFSTRKLLDMERNNKASDSYKGIPRNSCGDVPWSSSQSLTKSFDDYKMRTYHKMHTFRRTSDFSNDKFSQKDDIQGDTQKKTTSELYEVGAGCISEFTESEGDDDNYKELPSPHGDFKTFGSSKKKMKMKGDCRRLSLLHKSVIGSMDNERKPGVSEITSERSLAVTYQEEDYKNGNPRNSAGNCYQKESEQDRQFLNRTEFPEFDDEEEWIEYIEAGNFRNAESFGDGNHINISSGEEIGNSDSSCNESDDAGLKEAVKQDVDSDDDDVAIKRCKKCWRNFLTRKKINEKSVEINQPRSKDDMMVFDTLRMDGYKVNSGFLSAREPANSKKEGRIESKNDIHLNQWPSKDQKKHVTGKNLTAANVAIKGMKDKKRDLTDNGHYGEIEDDAAALCVSNHNNRCFQKVYSCENAANHIQSNCEEGLQMSRCSQFMQVSGRGTESNHCRFNKPFHFVHRGSPFTGHGIINHTPTILSSGNGNVIHQCCPDHVKQQLAFLEHNPSTGGTGWIEDNTSQMESNHVLKCHQAQNQPFQVNDSSHCQQCFFSQQQKQFQLPLNSQQMKIDNCGPTFDHIEYSAGNQSLPQCSLNQMDGGIDPGINIVHQYLPPPPSPPSHIKHQQFGHLWSIQDQLQREGNSSSSICRHHHHYLHANLYKNHATQLLHQLQDRLKRQKLMEDMKLDKSESLHRKDANCEIENSSSRSLKGEQMGSIHSKESCNSTERADMESCTGESSSRKKEATSLPDSQSISIFDSSLCQNASVTDNNKIRDCKKSIEFDVINWGSGAKDGCDNKIVVLKNDKTEHEKTASSGTSIRTDSAQSQTMHTLSKSNSFDKLYLDLIQNQLSSLKDSVQALTDAFYQKEEKKEYLASNSDVTECLVKNFSLLLKENQSLSKRFDHLEKALSETFKTERENLEVSKRYSDKNTTLKKSYGNTVKQQEVSAMPSKDNHSMKVSSTGETKSERITEPVSDSINPQGANLRGFLGPATQKIGCFFDAAQFNSAGKKNKVEFDPKILCSVDEKSGDPCFVCTKSEAICEKNDESHIVATNTSHVVENNNLSISPPLNHSVGCKTLEISSKTRCNNSVENVTTADGNVKRDTLDNGLLYAKLITADVIDETLNSSKSDGRIKPITDEQAVSKVENCDKFDVCKHLRFQAFDESDELSKKVMASNPMIYRSFVNNSTNRSSKGCSNVTVQQIPNGRDSSFYHCRLLNEENANKRLSPRERFSTSWKSDIQNISDKSGCTEKDTNLDERQHALFSHLCDSNNQTSISSPDIVCDSVMGLKTAESNKLGMNNAAAGITVADLFNDCRSFNRPVNEAEIRYYDFAPNVFQNSHKFKMSNLAQKCAELWDCGNSSKLPKSLKNHFLSGGCSQETDPCSYHYSDTSDQQLLPKLKKLNNANLDSSFKSLPLDFYEGKPLTGNMCKNTECEVGMSNFKLINVDVDRRDKQTESSSGGRFLCHRKIVNPCQFGLRDDIFVEPFDNELESNKFANDRGKTKSPSWKFPLTWNPDCHATCNEELGNPTNERKFLDRMKVVNSFKKVNDDISSLQTLENQKCYSERAPRVSTLNRNSLESQIKLHSIPGDESFKTIQGGNDDRDHLVDTKKSLSKQNTVNIVFNDGVRPTQNTQIDEIHKFAPKPAGISSSGHSMKKCLNMKKTNNINVNFSNNCSKNHDYCEAADGTFASQSLFENGKGRLCFGSGSCLYMNEAKEFDDLDLVLSCDDEHHDLSQFSSGPTADYVKVLTESGDAQGYDLRTEWDQPSTNNSLFLGHHWSGQHSKNKGDHQKNHQVENKGEYRCHDHIKAKDELRVTDSLERIYKEVSSFISANENRTQYLTELFSNLKKLDSEELRLKAVSVLNALVAEQLFRTGTLSFKSEGNDNYKIHHYIPETSGEQDGLSFVEIENWDIESQNVSDVMEINCFSYSAHDDLWEPKMTIKSLSQPTFQKMNEFDLSVRTTGSEGGVSEDRTSFSESKCNQTSSKFEEPSESLKTSVEENSLVPSLISSNPPNGGLQKEEGNMNITRNDSVHNEFVQNVCNIIDKKMNLPDTNRFRLKRFAGKNNGQKVCNDDEDRDQGCDVEKDNVDDDDIGDEGDDDDDNGDDDEEEDDEEDDDEEDDDDDNEGTKSGVRKEQIKVLVPEESKSSAQSDSSEDTESNDDDDGDEDDAEDDDCRDDVSDVEVDDDDEDDEEESDDDDDDDNDNDDDEEEDVTNSQTFIAKKAKDKERNDEDEDSDEGDEDDEDDEDEEDDDDDDGDDNDDDDGDQVIKGNGEGDGSRVKRVKNIECSKGKTSNKNHSSNRNDDNGDDDGGNDKGDSGLAPYCSDDCNFEDTEEDLIREISDVSFNSNEDDRNFRPTYGKQVDGRFNIPSHYDDEEYQKVHGEGVGVMLDINESNFQNTTEMLVKGGHDDLDVDSKIISLHGISAGLNNNKDKNIKVYTTFSGNCVCQLEDYSLFNDVSGMENAKNVMDEDDDEDLILEEECRRMDIVESKSNNDSELNVVHCGDLKDLQMQTEICDHQAFHTQMMESSNGIQADSKNSFDGLNAEEKILVSINENMEMKAEKDVTPNVEKSGVDDKNSGHLNENHDNVIENWDLSCDDTFYENCRKVDISSKHDHPSNENSLAENITTNNPVNGNKQCFEPCFENIKNALLIPKNQNCETSSDKIFNKWLHYKKTYKISDVFDNVKRVFGDGSSCVYGQDPNYSLKHSNYMVKVRPSKTINFRNYTSPPDMYSMLHPSNDPPKAKKQCKDSKHQGNSTKEQELAKSSIFHGRRKSSLSLSKNSKCYSKCDYLYEGNEDSQEDASPLISEEIDSEHSVDLSWHEDRRLLSHQNTI